ncbi:MAG: helix-turn-helix domain-containing protein [Nitrospinae bacterium]|nr:helix-turn-helix domain-containing protein [Nitrospinota bacterium]
MYIQMIKREDIKNIREKLGITQEEFARRIGVTVTTVSRWERGDCLPKSRVVIEKIEKLKKW